LFLLMPGMFPLLLQLLLPWDQQRQMEQNIHISL